MKFIYWYRPWEGNAIPNWYGVVYVSHNNASVLCLPIPLNFIVGVAYYAWVFVRGEYAMLANKILRRNGELRPLEFSLRSDDEFVLFHILTPYIEQAGYKWKLSSPNTEGLCHLTIQAI